MLLGATPISQDAQYDNGDLSYLFLNMLGPEPHKTRFAVAFSSYIPSLQMSPAQVQQQH